MKTKHLSRFLSCILMLSLILTGCGNSQKADVASADSSEANSSYKDTVIVGIDAEPNGLDNHSVSGNEDIYCFRMVYDRLVDIDPETYTVTSSLAESWDLSDPLNYQFKLRDNVYFHNGEKLTAEDVKWSFERQISTGVSKSFISSVGEIEVVDELNFILHLTTPDASLLAHLSSPCCSIQWHGSLDSGEWEAVGTGAYTMEEWKSGDSITFLRNENYWKRDVVTERVVFKIIPEETSRLIALEVGEIDVNISVDAGNGSIIANNPDLMLMQVASSGVRYLCLYQGDAESPLANIDVRHALSCAINKEDVIKAVENGNASAISSCLGFGSLYRFTDFEDDYSYDIERAKKLLADAGYPDGFSVSIIVKSGDKLLAEVLQDQFRQINVELSIDLVDSAAWTDATNNGKFQIFTALKNSSTGDPTDVMKQMYGPNKGKAGNRALYQNDRFDELYALQMAEGNDSVREGYVIEMQKIIMEDMPWILLYSPVVTAGASKNVGGFELNPATLHDLSGVYCVID